MGKPPVFRVKNWSDFQHYKKRNPPWIRLYRKLLDDRVFMDLPDASRALAPCMWLLASESDDGTVPANLEDLAWRLRKTVVWMTKALKPLVEEGFLEDASNVLAECLQRAIPDQIRSEADQSRAVQTPKNGFALFWAVYPRKVKKKAAFSAWEKIEGMAPELLQTILDSVSQHSYSEEWTRDKGRYVPYPASFLNGERWTDEVQTGPRAMTVEEIEARAQRGKPDYDSK
ncbi:MAG: hypothetical protein KAJ55_11525 [Anaerolineales bacterium]|nr:hypothetical protein [Anaerolineales bacterium]